MLNNSTTKISAKDIPPPKVLTKTSSLGLICAVADISPKISPQNTQKSLTDNAENQNMCVYRGHSDESNADYLPDELIYMIFSYLGVTATCRAGQVCQRWRNISQDELNWKKKFQKLWILPDFETMRQKYRHRLTPAEYHSSTWFQRYGVLFKCTFIWKTSSRMIEENSDENHNHSLRQRNIQQHAQSVHINNNNQQFQPYNQQIAQTPQIPQIQQQFDEREDENEPQIEMALSQTYESLDLNNSNISNNNNNSMDTQSEYQFSSSSSSTSTTNLSVNAASRSPRSRIELSTSNNSNSKIETQVIDSSKLEKIVEEMEMDGQ